MTAPAAPEPPTGVRAAEGPATVRILVADDHTLLREALCELLATEPGFEVVAQAGTGTETVALAARHRPDVLLLDIEMPENDPPVTVRRLLAQQPELRIIVLSMDDGRRLVQELLALGVCGYLHKSVSRQTLVATVRQRDEGKHTVTVSVSPGSVWQGGEAADDELPGGLSQREVEVLEWTAQALSNRQIGSRLGITEGTVKRHLRNIFGKLDAVSRIDAVNKAVELELIPPLGGRGRR
ncbi:response regulator transcription factor [Kitasatospora acidiphila]|uniref:Response regulator transcription factor n=1 Tax=Kitasatospora acidiphila TaxID=2567942 RepID=A0A540W5B4_9ACTN|nr:response regulator transcription factor [Kitasatospora acidiphila]TQF04192.1 response regulator transcription factor [Kitasatospora acidiphila]